jgi:hypothetical protein
MPALNGSHFLDVQAARAWCAFHSSGSHTMACRNLQETLCA